MPVFENDPQVFSVCLNDPLLVFENDPRRPWGSKCYPWQWKRTLDCFFSFENDPRNVFENDPPARGKAVWLSRSFARQTCI